MAAKPIKLAQHEYIVAVTPEHASGPGWSNRPLWVHIVDHATKQYRCECIQPEDQTAEQHALFAPGAAMAGALINSVAAKRLRGGPQG